MNNEQLRSEFTAWASENGFEKYHESMFAAVEWAVSRAATAPVSAAEPIKQYDDELVQYFDEWEQIIPQDAREALRTIVEARRDPKNY